MFYQGDVVMGTSICPGCGDLIDLRKPECGNCGNLVSRVCKKHQITYDLNVCPVCPLCYPEALEDLGMKLAITPPAGGVFTRACVTKKHLKHTKDLPAAYLTVPAPRFPY
jgi:hypothetical protein